MTHHKIEHNILFVSLSLLSSSFLILFLYKCFVHPIFRFLVFGHFWRRSYENTKILRNLIHFARQDGQDGKKWKENHATKVTKIPKTKRRKYGMNETFIMRSKKLYYSESSQIM